MMYMLLQRESGDCIVGQISAALGPEARTKHCELHSAALNTVVEQAQSHVVEGEVYRPVG